MRRLSFVAVLVLLFGGATVVEAAPPRGEPAGAVARADYLITVRSGADVDAGVAAARAAGGTVRFVYRHAVTGFAATLPSAAVDALANNPRVTLVEPDGAVTTSSTQTQTDATWGLDRLDQRDLPLDDTYTYAADGSGIAAYIVDTGVRAAHTDFGGRVTGGYTSIGDGRGTDDCDGHGTHVAGTVAGTAWGVAKAATVVPVRVLDCNGSGTWAGVIAGLDWIVATHDPVTRGVANMSLGGGASSTVDAAVQRVIDAGVPVVVAAGNSDADACNYSPARAANAVTVGATTSADVRASYSNVGTCLDLFAPGSGITSAWNTGDTATNTISGTSMAAPHVAGVVALELQGAPAATPQQIADAITANATIGAVSGSGTGSPNLLLHSLSGGPIEPPPPVELVDPAVSAITVAAGGGRWVNASAVVETVVAGDASSPAAGLGVTGNWYLDGGFVATQSGTTDANGAVSFSASVKVRSGTLDFCVSSLQGDAYTSVAYDPPVCSDAFTGPTDPTDPPPDDGDPTDPWGLEATATKVKGVQVAELRWTAAADRSVTISRDGVAVATVDDAGVYTHDSGVKGGGSYVYQVCDSTGAGCSAEITVTF